MSASYYARWMLAAERFLVEQGVLTDEEIDLRTRELALHPDTPVPRREDPEFADAMLGVVYAGVSPRREIDAPRRFDVGDRVVARGSGTDGHTRLPAYARDRTGVVVRCHDAFVFPDSNARRAGEDPHWCYYGPLRGRRGLGRGGRAVRAGVRRRLGAVPRAGAVGGERWATSTSSRASRSSA